MSAAGKMRHTESETVEIRIGSRRPKLYLVPKEKTKGVESLLAEYLFHDEANEESRNEIAEAASVSLDEAFRDLNRKYSKQGNVLCGLRLKKGWTQTMLAEKLGTSQSNIAAIENGKRRIGKKMARRLAQVLNTSYRVFGD